MKEFLIGSLVGMSAGLVVGGIMVAKNKKLSTKINDGIDKAEQKFNEIKNAASKKFKECNCNNQTDSLSSECDPNSKVCS